MRRISFSHILSLLLIGIVIFFAFNKLPQTFFQQDEWWTFGNILSTESGGVLQFLKQNILHAGKVHAIPVSAVIPYVEYRLFGVDFEGYAIFSLAIHLCSSVLVYCFCLLFFAIDKDRSSRFICLDKDATCFLQLPF